MKCEKSQEADPAAEGSKGPKEDLTYAKHLLHLHIILQLLRHHQLYAKRSKCLFGAPQVDYLGHYISAKGVSTNLEKLCAIHDWPLPQTMKQLQGFLGLTRYYQRFIHRYGVIS